MLCISQNELRKRRKQNLLSAGTVGMGPGEVSDQTPKKI